MVASWNFTIGNSTDPNPLPIYLNSLTFSVDASNAGQSIVITAMDNPELFSNLTNGLSDNIRLMNTTPAGGGNNYYAPESSFFSVYPTEWNGIDFQGYHIDNMSLTVNSITFNSPGSDPNHNGQWTDYSINTTLTVNGSVAPEPTTLQLIFALTLPVIVLGLGRRFSTKERC